MMIRHIDGAQVTIGESQGFLGLPVKYSIVDTVIGGKPVLAHAIETAWEPTPNELELIQNGHSIIVQLLTEQQPPIMLYVNQELSEGLDQKAKLVEELMHSIMNLKRFLDEVLQEQTTMIENQSPFFNHDEYKKLCDDFSIVGQLEIAHLGLSR